MLLRDRFAVPILFTGALLLPALPAAADDDDDHGRGHRGRGHHYRGHDRHHDRDHDRHRGHYRHGGHGGHHGGHGHRHHRGCGHGGGHGGWYGPRVVKHHYYSYPVHHYGYAPAAYCGPCGNHFDSYDDLSYHVHHHHHIAAIELPFVIFQASIGGGVGWVFGH